ncbi:hypothetical protein BOX15_Mlig004019g5 [Macrostomum lignano]|uniref:Nuclear pore complex protein Nup85 n=1 Tax=Macrostomum lignano TaxID=282301 RepID=A0A267FRI2_9PLAT|nr:hypothetical protein BOX15_Mlig004019g5 [Macrostomum lignano]
MRPSCTSGSGTHCTCWCCRAAPWTPQPAVSALSGRPSAAAQRRDGAAQHAKYSFVRDSQSVRKFDVAHCLWQKDVRVRLEAGLFAAHPQLELLVELLAGDEDAFARPEIVGLCDSWYQLLLARLLLTNPTGSLDCLGREAPEAEALYKRDRPSQRDGDGDGLLDGVLVRLLFDGQVGQFLAEAAGCLGSNWWFVAHLADLLHHCLGGEVGGYSGSGGGSGPFASTSCWSTRTACWAGPRCGSWP